MTKDEINYLIQRKPLEKALDMLPPNAGKKDIWALSGHYRAIALRELLKAQKYLSEEQKEWILEAIATRPVDKEVESMIDESIKANPDSFTKVELEARQGQKDLRKQYQGGN